MVDESPITNPQDDPNVDTDSNENGNVLDDLRESAGNLSPSEIPSPAEVPALLGALIYRHQHGEHAKPLDERFPKDER